MKVLTNALKAQGILISALLISNFFNFLFNAYLGRVLSFEEFGLITLLNSFLYILSIVLNAIYLTVNHHVSSFSEKNKGQRKIFIERIKRNSILFMIGVSAIWILLSTGLARFFRLESMLPLLIFTPYFTLETYIAVAKGALFGNLRFISVGTLLLTESMAKLLLAYIFIGLNAKHIVYFSLPLSTLFAFILAFLLTREENKHKKKVSVNANILFPKRFFVVSMLFGASSTLFLVSDVILAKHYLSPDAAGQYSLLSLIGKMIYFFGSLLGSFMVTFVSRDLAKGIKPHSTFYRFFSATFLLSAGALLFFGSKKSPILQFFFGTKIESILPFIPHYSQAIFLFTITNVIVLYHLILHQYLFPVLSILTTVLMISGIILFHENIPQIINVLFSVSSFALIMFLNIHLLQKNGRFILRNIIDLVDVLNPLPKSPVKKGKRRILIFNWRDLKHKYAGGAEVYIHELAKRWVKDGNKVTLFCGSDGNSKRNETIDGVNIVRRGGFYFVYFWAFIYYFFHFRGKYDVIIDCENGIPFFTPLYAKEKVYCLMFHVHQDVFFRSLVKPLAILASLLENRLIPQVYRKTKFITISNSTKKEMEALSIGAAGIEIITPGINFPRFARPIKKSKNPLVLYLGRLKYYKRLNVFIKSAKRVLKFNPYVRFIIAGDGEEKNGLKELTKKLHLENKIEFLGKVSEQQKFELYENAWVLVNPSLKEGWGITSIEANAFGTPVVAANVSGLRDSVKNPHTGFLVDPSNTDEFADKISLLIRDKNLRDNMSENSIKWAQSFNWDKSATQGIKLLQ